MNLLGKIFTVLIFFMSICFLVVAVMLGATHRDWKGAASEAQTKANFLESKIADVKQQTLDKEKLLDAERAARTLQLAQLESQLSAAVKNYEATNSRLQAAQSESQERLARMREAEDRLKEQDSEVEGLRKSVASYIDEIAAQRSAVVNFQNQVYELKGQTESLSQLNQDLSEQLAVTSKIMKVNGLDENSLTAHIPPQVEGVVARIKDTGDATFIAISLGKDDGLRVGHVMDVYRGDRFVGKAIITKVEYNMSVAKVDPAFEQDVVMEGDHVTTKL